jgi:FtsZ-interacting cell division protein ZipA
MKVCSQCEFIYEDDQDRCDMDGGELFYEPTLQSVFNAPPAQTLTAPPKVFAGFASTGKARMFVIAVLVLAAVVISGFYASRRLMSARVERATRQSVQSSIAPVTTNGKPEDKASSPHPSGATEASTSNQSPNSDQPPHTPSSSPSNQTPPESASPSSALKIETDEVATNNAPASARNQRSAHATNNRTRTATDSRFTIPRVPQAIALPRIPPLRRLPPVTLEKKNPSLASVNYKPERAGEKKPSRFGSFLKKTGRVLTKPFRG